LHLLVPFEALLEEEVVLQEALRARAREVQRERGHLAAEVTHLEEEVLRQPLLFAPHDPADAGIDAPYLWPEVEIECTRSRAKSQTRSGCRKGAIMAPDAPST